MNHNIKLNNKKNFLSESTIPIKFGEDVIEFIIRNFRGRDKALIDSLNELSLLNKAITRNPNISRLAQEEFINILRSVIKKDKQIGDYLIQNIFLTLGQETKNFINLFKKNIKEFLDKGGTYEEIIKIIDDAFTKGINGKPVFQSSLPELDNYVKKDFENFAKEIATTKKISPKSSTQVNQKKDYLTPFRGTKNKEVFGKGIEHQIFVSRNNPNVLFKVGQKDIVEEWLDVFKSNPEIFPKVYRNGKLKDGNFYVEIEKLNTSKFEKNWDDLEMALEDIGALDTDRGQSLTDLYVGSSIDDKIFVDIGKKLKTYNSTAYSFFKEYLNVVKKCEKAIFSVKGKSTFVDAHKYNFGYSSDGKIKCLDL